MNRKGFRIIKGGVRLVSDDSKIGAKKEPFPLGSMVITTGSEKYDRCPLNTLGIVKVHAIGCYGIEIQVGKYLNKGRAIYKTKLFWFKKQHLAHANYAKNQ